MNNNEILQHHMEDDRKFQEEQTLVNARMDRAIFGSKADDEMGMKEKVDKMYELLVQSRGIIGFFGGLRGGLTLLLTIVAVIAWFKGWIK